MKPIRVMMADDSPEIRNYFASFISHETDMELAGTASSGAEAVSLARETKPDIILMDIQMETREAGITASRKILEEMPATRVSIWMSIRMISGRSSRAIRTASAPEEAVPASSISSSWLMMLEK